jgi:kumamolisin
MSVSLVTTPLAGAANRKASAHRVAPMVRLPGHVLPALAKATAVASQSKAAADESLTLTLVLKRDDQAGFERYLRDVYDPKSPNYRKFLTQSELSDRFGPSREVYDDVLSYLQENGFTLVEGSANRMTLTVHGTRFQTERAFAVRIGDYKIGEKRFYANDTAPALPQQIASRVEGVIGLSNLAQSYHVAEAISAAQAGIVAVLNCVACYAGQDAQTAQSSSFDLAQCATAKKNNLTYNAGTFSCVDPPNPGDWRFVDGNGQTVGLLAFDTFNVSDVSDYLSLIGADPSRINNLSQVHINGGATLGADQAEVLLDINNIISLAPAAQVVVYDSPFTGAGSFQTLFNAMINDGVDVISNSWAYCEDQTTLADVQSIELILQNAVAAGISVFNGSGDTGGTCLDGAANTVAVPASSPSATAVGGTSLTTRPGPTYGTETWWNGSSDIPPTGQGGFGVSRFFSRPSYQDGFTASAMRSVPDVVANSDPASGVIICQAGAGGCPSGLLYGGTSSATPIWAAFAALLNQALGVNLGALNPVLYPLANTNAFNPPTSMGSDFTHVGLGSPNLNVMKLLLAGQTAGPPSAEQSEVYQARSNALGPVPADGVSEGSIVIRLRDALGNTVSDKTITLVSNGSATIDPAGGVVTDNTGAAVFTITNLTPETVTFTATDVTDGIVLDQQPSVTFAVPPAASASINASPTTVTANGIATTTIAVMLKDALNRPTPGKLVTLSQGNGHSLITGPNPSVTDSNGQIQFTATNLVNEVVTYTAVDVTDGNLPVPGNAVVTFNNGSGGACGQNTPPAVGLNGYTVTPFATGFATGSLFYGNINFGGCSGVAPLGFLDGDAYIPNFLNGDLFKLGLGGGVVSNANKLSTIAPTLGWVVTGKDGKLYATRTAVDPFPPNFTNGAVVELDPLTGAVKRTLASNLPCSQGLVVDPLSGDLFFDGQCFGAGSNNANLFRVRNPGSPTPTLEVYATLPSSPNGQIAFSPKGTIYVVVNYLLSNPPVYRVSGTDVPGPPTVTLLPGVVSNYWLNVGNVDATGEATTLVTLNVENNVARLKLTNITTNPPTITATMTEGTGGGTIGPDGCLYMPNANVMHKLTDPTGGCSFVPTAAAPSLTLTPTVVSPNPAQGTAQTFTATFRNLDVPADTPVFFAVVGANPRLQLVRTDANGEAPFTYTAVNQGMDTIVATATVDNSTLTSNTAKVTWEAGKHMTFLTLNPSPKGGMPGIPVNVIASLTDVSVDPLAPIAGATINFTLGNTQCSGVTDADGIASCQLAPNSAGMWTLTATFAGSGQFMASSDSVGFNVLSAPSGGIEVCGNCVDEDGDSLPDLLDPDCASTSPLTLLKGILSLNPAPDKDKLTLRGTFTAAVGSVDPPTQGVTISLVDTDGQITCLSIPPGEGWKTNKKQTVWRFMDKRDDSLGDPEADERCNLRYDVKKGVFRVQVNIKEAELTDAEAGEISTGISIGERTFVNTQTWRSTAKGKKLTTP